MRNAFITEVGTQWVVTVEFGDSRRQQQYVCDSLKLARRWVLLLNGPVREHPSFSRGQPAA